MSVWFHVMDIKGIASTTLRQAVFVTWSGEQRKRTYQNICRSLQMFWPLLKWQSQASALLTDVKWWFCKRKGGIPWKSRVFPIHSNELLQEFNTLWSQRTCYAQYHPARSYIIFREFRLKTSPETHKGISDRIKGIDSGQGVLMLNNYT